MTTYVYPTSVRAVSDSFAAHVARKSVNPGTDYMCKAGTLLVSVAAGVVADAHGAPDGSGGRRIHVNHDDGSGADYLHLQSLSVSVGDRVAQGQKLGTTGTSANGSNTGIAAHLHISFRPNHAGGYGNVGNIDFDAMMTNQNAAAGGGGTPLPEEDEDMKLTLIRNHDGSVGVLNPDGTLSPIEDPEVIEGYKRLGIVVKQPNGDYWLQQPDGTVWNLLVQQTQFVERWRATLVK